MRDIICAVVFFAVASAIEELKPSRPLLTPSSTESVDSYAQWLPSLVGSWQGQAGASNPMNSTVFVSVSHYHCADDKIKDQDLMLYGTKSWTFPLQDVNLTLSYPVANHDLSSLPEEEDYMVTGFNVVLLVDGLETKGYIMNGGIHQKSLVLSFLSQNVTSLGYEFWLYGAPKHVIFALYDRYNIKPFVCT